MEARPFTWSSLRVTFFSTALRSMSTDRSIPVTREPAG